VISLTSLLLSVFLFIVNSPPPTHDANVIERGCRQGCTCHNMSAHQRQMVVARASPLGLKMKML